MKVRRSVLIATAILVLGVPGSAPGQQGPKTHRIGYMASPSDFRPGFDLMFFETAMRELGYVEGRNLVILKRSPLSDDRLPESAAELVRANVHVIVAEGPAAVQAARRATRSIPVVMAIGGDPVISGLVASLARPGGNVTGITWFSLELVAKRLQILKETVPKARRVAVLRNAASAEKEAEWGALQAAAPGLGVTLLSLDVRRSQDFEPAVAQAVRQGAEALVVLDDALTTAYASVISGLAAKVRLPTIFARRVHAQPTATGGGLMAYGPSFYDLTMTAAGYVDRIFKGAKPGDLPVQQPTRFEFVINLRAARAIGLTIPQSVLVRADRVFE